MQENISTPSAKQQGKTVVGKLIVQPHGGALKRAPAWLPGVSGNPRGRPTAGMAIQEWFNQLSDADEVELRRVASDKGAPASKRQAALQHLDALRVPDLADIEAITDGTESLTAARARGIVTSDIRKIKVRRSTTPDGVEVVEREVELHPEKRGEALDRIMDRTEGKAVQVQRIQVESIIDPVAALARIRADLVGSRPLQVVADAESCYRSVERLRGDGVNTDAVEACEDEGDDGDDGQGVGGLGGERNPERGEAQRCSGEGPPLMLDSAFPAQPIDSFVDDVLPVVPIVKRRVIRVSKKAVAVVDKKVMMRRARSARYRANLKLKGEDGVGGKKSGD